MSRYVLICNPDVIFKKNYFKNLFIYLDQKIIFNILGSQYEKKKCINQLMDYLIINK